MSTSSRTQRNLTIPVARLPKAGMPIEFNASESERRRIADDLSLLDLPSFSGRLVAVPWHQSGVRVSGLLQAIAVHESVVTVEPVERSYSFKFEVLFVPANSKLAPVADLTEQELVIDPEGDDPPETFTGDEIDLGALVEEHLALELDPYPREQDAAFETVDTDPEPDAGKVSPFDALGLLKKQQSGEN